MCKSGAACGDNGGGRSKIQAQGHKKHCPFIHPADVEKICRLDISLNRLIDAPTPRTGARDSGVINFNQLSAQLPSHREAMTAEATQLITFHTIRLEKMKSQVDEARKTPTRSVDQAVDKAKTLDVLNGRCQEIQKQIDMFQQAYEAFRNL
jgi:hypothetical protein